MDMKHVVAQYDIKSPKYTEMLVRLKEGFEHPTLEQEAIQIASTYGLKKTPEGFYLLNANKKLEKTLPSTAKHKKLLGLELLPAAWTYQNFEHVASGVNVCPKAGTCALKNACLVFSSPYSSAMQKRGKRKALMLEEPRAFAALLIHDIKKGMDKKAAFRLNVFSDILWEHVLPKSLQSMLSGNIYDYTKIKGRPSKMPKGFDYKLTYSFHEKDTPEAIPELVKEHGSVAVVFAKEKNKKLPTVFQSVPVINGDEHDYRLQDKGVVVGLVAKGGLTWERNQGHAMLVR